MLVIRKAQERGHAQFGWLDSWHTFSFGEYHDPRHMGFGPLRVINEDRVQPGKGFATHGHRDMEIFSYVLEGELAHRDSMGHGSTIKPGDVQVMSAGTGIQHSEYNHSASALVHFLQIWIIPARQGLEPRYAQTHFSAADRRGRLRLIGSADGREGSVVIHQDVALYAALLEAGESLQAPLAAGRRAWLQVARGVVSVEGRDLAAGDGLAVEGEAGVAFTARDGGSEILLFDLP